METQHQVPQHIASYEFRLVGDMTLKQFFQVAGGALVALLFYASPLPEIIKWPFVLICGLIGVALAFLPFEERPLSIWIISFLRAIYSPTQYIKTSKPRGEIFAPEEKEVSVSQIAATPRGVAAAEEYLASPPQTEVVVTSLEEEEKSFLEKIAGVFQQGPTPQPRPTFVIEEKIPVTIPQTQMPQVAAPQRTFREQAAPIVPPAFSPTPVSAITQMQTTGQPMSARFTTSAAPPLARQNPNAVIGQVIDETGLPVDGAILEIRDGEGRPVRALRTNKVGHFLTATPLSAGTYEIIIEKEGFEFSPIQFTAQNEVILPIEIKGKRDQNLELKTISKI